MKKTDPAARLLSKCDKRGPNECWEWTGSFFIAKTLPYGQFWMDGKTTSAHRASYKLFNGPIENGLHVLHKCNNSKCINPSHLYLGDHIQNMKDRDESGRTSKGEDRYNYIRFKGICDWAFLLRKAGLPLSEILSELKISRTTYYRIRGSIPDFPRQYFRGVA